VNRIYRVLLVALTAGLGFFAMGILIEPQGLRQATLDLLARLIAAGKAGGVTS
jgi:hypothetical protein